MKIQEIVQNSGRHTAETHTSDRPMWTVMVHCTPAREREANSPLCCHSLGVRELPALAPRDASTVTACAQLSHTRWHCFRTRVSTHQPSPAATSVTVSFTLGFSSSALVCATSAPPDQVHVVARPPDQQTVRSRAPYQQPCAGFQALRLHSHQTELNR